MILRKSTGLYLPVCWSRGRAKPVKYFLAALTVLMYGLVKVGASDSAPSFTSYACEDTTLKLECPEGAVIRIQRANYGRFTYSVCNRHGQTEGWDLNCMYFKAKDTISERCDGRQNCDMNVSNYVFGDSCPLTTKYAEVKFTCQLAASDTPPEHPTTAKHLSHLQPPMLLNQSPQPPHITSAVAVSPTEINVTWTQAQSQDAVVTTIAYYKDQAMETPAQFFTNSVKSISINDLRSNTTYEIFMKSFNSHSLSVPSNRVKVSTLPLVSSPVTWSRALFSVTTKDTAESQPRLTYLTKELTQKPSHYYNTVNLSTSSTVPTTKSSELLKFFKIVHPSLFTLPQKIPSSADADATTNPTVTPTTTTLITTTIITSIYTTSTPGATLDGPGSVKGKHSQLSAHIRVFSSRFNKDVNNTKLMKQEESMKDTIPSQYSSTESTNSKGDSNAEIKSDPPSDKSNPNFLSKTPTQPVRISQKNDHMKSSKTENTDMGLEKSSEWDSHINSELSSLLPTVSNSSGENKEVLTSTQSSANKDKKRNNFENIASEMTKYTLKTGDSNSDSLFYSSSPAVQSHLTYSAAVHSMSRTSLWNTHFSSSQSSSLGLSSMQPSAKFPDVIIPEPVAEGLRVHGPQAKVNLTPERSIPFWLSSSEASSQEDASASKLPAPVNEHQIQGKGYYSVQDSVTISTVTSVAMPQMTGAHERITATDISKPPPIDKEMRGPSDWLTSTSTPKHTTSTTTTTTTTNVMTSTPVIEQVTLRPLPGHTLLTHRTSSGPRMPDEDIQDINSGVVDKFCGEMLYKGVLWPQTRYGHFAEGMCPQGLEGTAKWHCQGYGWEKSGPDLSDCISSWLNHLDSQIHDEIRQGASDEAAVVLNEAVQDQELTSGDLKQTATILLPRLTESLSLVDPKLPKPVKKRKLEKFKKAFLKTSSNLLAKKNIQSWHNLSKQDQQKSATALVLAVEETGFHTASLMNVGELDATVDENILMEVSVLDPQQVNMDVTFPSRNYLSNTQWADSLTISKTSLKVAGKGGLVNIVFTLYENMEDLVQPQWNTVTSIPATSRPNDGEMSYNAGTIRDSNTISSPGDGAVMVINTKIIAASINSKHRQSLPEPVRFTLRHLEPSNEAVPVCSFWEMDPSYKNGWSHEGCNLVDTNSTHTTCECNHLTNFAVLMDVSGVKLSEENELALRVITYVGCVVSIFCLILSWVTFMVFKNLQCDRNTIHKNLVLCLLLAEIVFLGGIAQTKPKLLCSIIAGVLHYLFLGAFAWMCLEGVQLYVMLVEVFEQEKSRVHWYYLFGYGVPAVIVAISAGVYYPGYGTPKHCWLTTDNYFIWSFVGPALAVMLINIGMLSIAIYTMCRHSNMSAAMRERSKVTKFSVTESLSSMETFASPKLRFPELPVWVKGAIVLVVLLGLTWLLGVLYLNEESVVIAYLFTILNSLQGLFVFVFHCLKNEKVQKEYRKVARRTSWFPNCIRVNYGGYTGVASSSPVGSSGSGNYLSKIFGPRTRKRSAASTNSSAKPFLSKDQQRKSEMENSSSQETSNVPSSLNGYVYNPSYSNPNGGMQTPFLANGMLRSAEYGPAGLTPCYETLEGLTGELSEYLDCSVIDSELVSEYCKHNMQVSMEQRRYSTGSEDSDVMKSAKDHHNLDVDNLSTLSQASSNKKLGSNASISEEQPTYGVVNEASEGKHLDLRLDLHQYIIPTSKKNNNNNLDAKNSYDNVPKKCRRTDNKSASMNKLSKPVPSLSSIPESDISPQHSSTPNLQFTPDLANGTPDSSEAQSPAQDIPVYEKVKIVQDASLSGKNSLPNLNSNSVKINYRENPFETDSQVSPFRFTSSDC